MLKLKHFETKQIPQACGGGSRRSEVVVPVENRHGIIPKHLEEYGQG